MTTPQNINELIARMKSQISEKTAQTISNDAPVTEGGAKPVKEEDKKSDPEVTEDNPSGAFEVNPSKESKPEQETGAAAIGKPGYTEEPSTKETTSDNAMTKTKPGEGSSVAKQAEELLALVRDGIEEPKKAEPKKDEPKVNEDKKVNETKKAEGPDFELTTDVLAKVAAVMLADEEGAEFVQNQLVKNAGAEAATEVVEFLNDQFSKARELQEKQEKLAQMGGDIADASIEQAIAQLPPEELAALEAQGAGAGLPAGVPGPVEGAEIPEDITIEDVAEVLSELVQEGTIDEATAEAALAEVIAAAESGGAPVEPAPVEGTPVENVPGGEPSLEAPATDPKLAASEENKPVKKN